MAGDDRKPTFSERDRMRREGGERPRSERERADQARRTRDTLAAADALFGDGPDGKEGRALADTVRAAHGTSELPVACRAYLEGIGPPRTPDLASIFLDAGDKLISIAALDALLELKASGSLEIAGGLKRQIRLLSEDFDDELASRAEDLLD
jgi:hypothetical protein